MIESDEDTSKKAEDAIEKLGASFHYECYKENKPESCHQYAEYLTMVKKEPQQALELFRKTCEEMKLGESCLALGNMYLTGKGTTKNISTAFSLYDKSCDQGSMGGCNNAGLIAQEGHDDLLPDGKMAEQYFKRSCDGGLVDKDMSKALEYSLKSCEMGHPWGCGNASRILRIGDGVPQDTKKGNQLLERAKQLSHIHLSV